MEDMTDVLQDLLSKQERTKSELALNVQNLRDKIEDNFDTILNQLRRNRESELRMVENIFAETEEEIRVNIQATRRIIEKLKADASGKELDQASEDLGLKNERGEDQNDKFLTEQKLQEAKSFMKETAIDPDRRNEDNRGVLTEMNKGQKQTVRFNPTRTHSDYIQHRRQMTLPNNDTKSAAEATRHSSVKYSVKIHGTYNIRTDDDTNVCDINRICCLENGGVVLVDTKNARLKVLDNEFNVVNATENCDYICSPFGICHLNDDKFVFTDNTYKAGLLRYMNIDKTGNMKYIKAFSTGVKNWSVVCKGENLYVIGMQNGNPYYHIRRYTKNGGPQLGGLGIKGEFMCFNSDKSTLYVTRGTTENKKSNYVAVVDHNDWFNERTSFWHPDLNVPCGMAVDEHDQVFVCGFASKNVLQFDNNGNKIDTLLEGDDALNGPKVLGYDKICHQLIVAGNADIIKVFDLKQ